MKKSRVVLYIIFILLTLTTSVYATINGRFGLDYPKKAVHGGDEISVDFFLTDLETLDGEATEITNIEGYMDFDHEETFDKITIDSIVTNEDGKVVIGDNNVLDLYSEEEAPLGTETGVIFYENPERDWTLSEAGDYKIVFNLQNPISVEAGKLTDRDNPQIPLFSLKLKVKSDAYLGRYENVLIFKYFSVTLKTKEENQLLSRGFVTITIDQELPPAPENNVVNNVVTNNAVNNVVNNTVNNIVVNNVVNNEERNLTPQGENPLKDNTITPQDLPKTGYKVVIFPLVVIAIVGYIFYRKYKKYDYHE